MRQQDVPANYSDEYSTGVVSNIITSIGNWFWPVEETKGQDQDGEEFKEIVHERVTETEEIITTKTVTVTEIIEE